MLKTDRGGTATTRRAKKAAPPSKSAPAKGREGKAPRKPDNKANRSKARKPVKVSAVAPVVIRETKEPPEGLPKKYFLKSTFNTHDIMHSPVEKTLKMLDKILQGERLFTM
ncbi:MAG: hypothetical protein Kow0074_21850 [Candidatus Zixiibacteriota bacterium]